VSTADSIAVTEPLFFGRSVVAHAWSQNITWNRNFRAEGAFVKGPQGTGAKRKRRR
jgi:hypothetical protein